MNNDKNEKGLINQQEVEDLYAGIRNILANARQRAYSAVNFAMVESYWLIGQQIVEHEQHGEARADYGKGLLKELAAKLSVEFGKGFDESNLRYMRLFYRCFPIRDTLRHELTWSHYRRLISVENEQARIWYMNEAADSVWSTRQMDRQISTLYYERLLASKDKAPVVAEAKQKMSELKPEQFIHDPFVLEFLNLKEYPALRESDIEQALIDHLQQFLSLMKSILPTPKHCNIFLAIKEGVAHRTVAYTMTFHFGHASNRLTSTCSSGRHDADLAMIFTRNSLRREIRSVEHQIDYFVFGNFSTKSQGLLLTHFQKLFTCQRFF